MKLLNKSIISVIILSCIFFFSCMYSLSKEDIETPRDTIRTLQWVLNRIKNKNFLYYFEELFTDEGEDIVDNIERLMKAAKETNNPDKDVWAKLQAMYEKVIIKMDKLDFQGHKAKALCSYYFPDNYLIKKVEINFKKTSSGWQILAIKPVKANRTNQNSIQTQ